jgi:hypothetical protein
MSRTTLAALAGSVNWIVNTASTSELLVVVMHLDLPG